MQYLTWGDIKSEVQKEYNIEGDPEYDENELINMCNRAINRVEARIIQLQQDYFLTKTDSITLAAGETSTDLPADIYANKIRRVFWQTTGYNKKRLYRATNIDDMETDYANVGSYEDFKKLRYMIFNNGTSGLRIELSYNKTDSELIIYYTRNAARFTVAGGDAQVCDIPEYADAVIAYMGYLVEKKDKSPTLASTKQEYIDIMTELTSSLAQAVNDEDMMIEPDTEIFDDHA